MAGIEITVCLDSLVNIPPDLTSEGERVFMAHCLTKQIDALCCQVVPFRVLPQVAMAPITAPPATGPTSIQGGKPNIFGQGIQPNIFGQGILQSVSGRRVF